MGSEMCIRDSLITIPGCEEKNAAFYESHGMARKTTSLREAASLAVALAGDPDFLVLDEPVNGLDPQGIIEIRELIWKLNREHQITVLISSHILGELSKLATHYGFIDGGRMVKEISAAELEAACRKCLRLEVTDAGALARVLDEMGVEYKILSDTLADVFAKYFDEENYFTWLAFQMLTGNTDTTSQNFLLYSPQNSQKWYFISWDLSLIHI